MGIAHLCYNRTVRKSITNFAFIDGNNLHRSTLGLGWPLDTKKFRRYLAEKYGVSRAFYFIGKVESNGSLYATLMSRGYELVFKETYVRSGEIKGNIDAELVLHAMQYYTAYDKAVIVSSDGDFACLAKYLKANDKLQIVIACSHDGCSHLIEKAVGPRYICYMDDLRSKLEYKKY